MQPDFKARALERAGKDGFSAYVVRLIESDLSNGPKNRNVLSDSIIADLTSELLGKIEGQEIEGLLVGINQPLLLQKLLRSNLDTLRAKARKASGKSPLDIARETVEREERENAPTKHVD